MAAERSQVSPHSPALARWPILFAGIIAISTASVLIRLAEAPALVVGAWRLSLAALLLSPWAWPRLRRERAGLTRRDLLLLGLAGVLLAVHFGTWITSLSLTTVASSVILVTTNPIYVGLVSHFLLGERVSAVTVLAIAIALMGSVIVSYGDLGVSGQALLGDALALVGALAMSGYILLGRRARRKLSTLAYAWPCYSLAALILIGLCLVSGRPLLGYGERTYLVFLLLAIVPQVLGHSVVNWALGHVPPVVVTLAILGEPIGASVLAYLVLHEVPPLASVLGGVLILTGIYLASREARQPGASTLKRESSS